MPFRAVSGRCFNTALLIERAPLLPPETSKTGSIVGQVQAAAGLGPVPGTRSARVG